MYRAKTLGKNGFQFFTANVNEEVLVRQELENHLSRSLERNELQLFYQPQYRGRGRLVGFEALLRWNHPKLGMIPPARFIPIAEESGIILSIGAWVLEQACRQMCTWTQAGFQNLTMAVNVSMIQFERRDWADSVEQVLKTTGLPPSCLELELTESVVMQNAKEAATRLNQLRKLGVRLAIDDFGTGYSSLNYLQQLPIDTLKIDQSFIENLHPGSSQDPSSEAIVRAIIALAKSMDLNLIAEGVETEWQEDFLRKHGCEGMQGFLFARPMPPEACEALLQSFRALGHSES
jgi:EAL domain-containing protein (putative c-di-GMP-specific phosphodiesterase class I)